MPSPSESKIADIVVGHLAEIAAGRCSITDEEIDEAARADPALAEVLTGLLFLHEDLTLRTAQRDRALADALAAVRELDAFSYSAAHDLRAPVRKIGSFSELLLRTSRDHLDADGIAYAQHMRDAARQMAQLIDDLLMLAQATRGELRRERVDLSELVRTTLNHLQGSEPARRLEARIQDGLVARGDAALLASVLTNLLGNAWKFTGKRPVARIEFGALPGTHPTTYYIRDNGAGFDMAHADKLFTAFQRLHATEDFGGTGIGLATVQRIVRRHGGRIWAEGEVDKGATFYFTLDGGAGR